MPNIELDSSDIMKAIWNNKVIAESDETVVVEGNHYFPINSIKKEYYHKTETNTTCFWKGKANYYSITVDDKTNEDCAWYYDTPLEKAENIKGMVAFWKGVQVN